MDLIELEYHSALCNTRAFAFAAAQWQKLVHQGLTSKEGGYTLHSHHSCIVAVINHEVVGVLVYDEFRNTEDKAYYWIDFICTHDDYKKQGVAREMLESLERHGEANEVSYIELGTHKSNKVMQRTMESVKYIADSITYRKVIGL